MSNGLGVVVLAAGKAARMGGPKLLLELGDDTLLGHVLKTAACFDWSGRVVVTGEPRGPLEEVCKKYGFPFVHNPDPGAGQSSSLRLGLSRLPAGLDGVLFLLGDQPLVGVDLVEAMIREFGRSGKEEGIVVPFHGGEARSPVLFASRWREALSRLEGDRGGRQLIKENPRAVISLPWNDSRPFLDIDRWEDYEKVLREWLKT
ncbi:MAG: nucleotidyltransferase family protein [Peptococcaceae bacterium]|jgi:molybdenum cofactor cytidylyltransferase|nr:nucleotidyltransferase family protein [Peptococcaceae bacterium]MDH7524598.1 nucleotidyltransferase family protein [Peptococcaceae bacterium]